LPPAANLKLAASLVCNKENHVEFIQAKDHGVMFRLKLVSLNVTEELQQL
jgi:hypothetical protein